MTAERFGEDPAVLSEGLAMSAVVLACEDRTVPVQLAERVVEARMVGREPLVELGSPGDVPGAFFDSLPPRTAMELHRAPDRLEGGPDLRKGVLLEKYQVVAEGIEPVDEPVELDRRHGPSDRRGTQRHGTGSGSPEISIAVRPRRPVLTPGERCRCVRTKTVPAFLSLMNVWSLRPGPESAVALRGTVERIPSPPRTRAAEPATPEPTARADPGASGPMYPTPEGFRHFGRAGPK